MSGQLNRSKTRPVSITDPRHKADPFPFYAHLRAGHPVHPVMLGRRRRAWLISRYDDVVSVLRDPRRLRALVSKAFTPGAVERMRDRIEWLTLRLLDELRSARRIDLIADFARRMPTAIIAELLGVTEADSRRFCRWTRSGLSAGASPWRMALAIPALFRFLRFIRQLIRARRESGSGREDDLLGALIAARDGNDRLDEDELVAMVFLLLVAGHETVVNLIGNGMLALLLDPEQLRRLTEQPDRMEVAVEELLRFAGPLETATERYAAEDLEIAGVTIPRGEMVFAGLASANRDPRVFDVPDRLDLGRQENPHLAFGVGPHHCLGASLARLEARIAFSTFLQAFSRVSLACPPHALRWRRGLVLRGLESLPIRVERGAARCG